MMRSPFHVPVGLPVYSFSGTTRAIMGTTADVDDKLPPFLTVLSRSLTTVAVNVCQLFDIILPYFLLPSTFLRPDTASSSFFMCVPLPILSLSGVDRHDSLSPSVSVLLRALGRAGVVSNLHSLCDRCISNNKTGFTKQIFLCKYPSECKRHGY